MANKPFNSRIQLKHDTEAHWILAQNFSPLAGELIIYDVDAAHSTPRFKVGDGTTNVNNLPFMTSGTNNLVVTTTNISASDSLTAAALENSLENGQTIFLFLNSSTIGSSGISLQFGSSTAINLYVGTSTQLVAAYAAGSLIHLLYNNNKLHVINAPVAI